MLINPKGLRKKIQEVTSERDSLRRRLDNIAMFRCDIGPVIDCIPKTHYGTPITDRLMQSGELLRKGWIAGRYAIAAWQWIICTDASDAICQLVRDVAALSLANERHVVKVAAMSLENKRLRKEAANRRTEAEEVMKKTIVHLKNVADLKNQRDILLAGTHTLNRLIESLREELKKERLFGL